MTRPALIPELDVARVRASLRFYVEVLGFAVAYERPEEGFAYLERQLVHLMLQQAEGPGRRFRTAPLRHPHGRGVNFQLEVTDIADIDGVHERITARGHELVVPLEDRWYRTGAVEVGQRQLVVADPDGYLWRPFALLGSRAAVPAGHDVAGGDRSDQT